MIKPILTKITLPPPTDHYVARERLQRQLDAGKTARLILIAAAAGFGKSTTVRMWLEGVSGWKTWVALDEGDDDLSQFLNLWVSAIQQIDVSFGKVLETMLEQPELPPIERLLEPMISNLAALTDHGYMVLDDYHLLQQPSIHKAVNYLLQNLPANVTLIIMTRYDPPLVLSRIRVKRQLVELRANDLRFSPAETETFIHEVGAIELSRDDVERMTNRTEGWVAGLQLASVSLQQAPDPAAFFESFAGSDRFVMDYLFEEVLARQSEEVRTFLMQTSILERLNGGLCDAVLERDRSQRILIQLERLNLFIVPLSGDHRWFRFYRIFRDLLSYRLREECSAETIRVLHQRAAVWFAEMDYPDEAITHALAAGEMEFVQVIIFSYAYILLDREQTGLLQRWLDRLPPAIRVANVQLQLIQAWILVRRGRIAELRALVSQLNLFEDQLPTGEFSALRCALSQFGQFSMENFQLAEQTRTQIPLSNRFIHAQLTQVLALGFTALNRRKDYEKLIVTMRHEGNERAVLHGYLPHILVSVLQGQLDRAAYVSQLALAQARRLNAFESLVTVHQELGIIAYQRNQLKEAEEHFQNAFTLGQEAYLLNQVTLAGINLAWLAHLRGDTETADTMMNEARGAARTYHAPGMVDLVEASQARLWLARGKTRQALEWADQYTFRPDGIPILDAFSIGMRVIGCFLARPTPERLAKADVLINEVLDLTLGRGLNGLALYALLAQGVLFDQQNRGQQAMVPLTQALTMSHEQRNIRFAADVGSQVVPLLRRYLEGTPNPRLSVFVYSLIAVIEQEHSTGLALRDPLSDRELEVLRLMLKGLSNEQIAERLVVAVGTVKKHTSTIYAKLEVSNRAQAVIRAQELNIL
jgi:LuxR family maltose regulon positive regulatory protein